MDPHPMDVLAAMEIGQEAKGRQPEVVESPPSTCRQAEFEYGHDGYNGTISTSHGVVEIRVKVGRIMTQTFINACWEVSYAMEDAYDGTPDLRVPLKKLPARLHEDAIKVAKILVDSKRGTWAAIRLEERDRKAVKKSYGYERKQVQVWEAIGWAAE